MNRKLIALVVAGAVASAADIPEDARECVQCHGEAGRSEKPDVPSIGGFSAYAIADLLESYRAGSRKGRTYAFPDGTETDMVAVSRALTEDQIDIVGTYFEGQAWAPHEQPFDLALAKRGAQIHDIKCAKCHSERGSVPEDDLALTLGQWREYLELEFADFDSGDRRMTEKMKAKYDTLSAEDKKALLELYVSGGRF